MKADAAQATPPLPPPLPLSYGPQDDLPVPRLFAMWAFLLAMLVFLEWCLIIAAGCRFIPIFRNSRIELPAFFAAFELPLLVSVLLIPLSAVGALIVASIWPRGVSRPVRVIAIIASQLPIIAAIAALAWPMFAMAVSLN
jgi:hypothetical protein